MTIYQTNYHNRLTAMCEEIANKYGVNHPRTIAFFREVEKRRYLACYQHREELEEMFKGWMK